MRIRSIVPKFWESKDVERLSWDTRLVFIGLWSYADDNGVGRDDPRLIAADLFPLADDPLDTRARVSRGLQELCDGGQVMRYTVDGEPFFFIVKWDTYQRVDRPAKERYKRPTCDDAEFTIEIATPSRDIRDSAATGEGEKGRRGEVVNTSATAAPKRAHHTYPDDFLMFWEQYPKKVGKDAALKAWKSATQRASVEDIIAGAKRYAADETRDPKFTKDPQGWLTAGKWADQPEPPRVDQYKQFRMLG